ncbi:MAG: S-adenosylmethionine decarboxylase [Acidiferrobacterales bacterium]
MISYGKELILDLRDCDSHGMTREQIGAFMAGACTRMEVEACDLHFWDDKNVPLDECQTDPKKKGVSAVQFLLTSSITLHALELRREVYINAFSCEEFDDQCVADWALLCFRGRIVWRHVIYRGLSDRTLTTHRDDFDMLLVGLDRVVKLCDWAIEHVEDVTSDPLGEISLDIDYEDLRDEVRSIGHDLAKIGLAEDVANPPCGTIGATMNETNCGR